MGLSFKKKLEFSKEYQAQQEQKKKMDNFNAIADKIFELIKKEEVVFGEVNTIFQILQQKINNKVNQIGLSNL